MKLGTRVEVVTWRTQESCLIMVRKCAMLLITLKMSVLLSDVNMNINIFRVSRVTTRQTVVTTGSTDLARCAGKKSQLTQLVAHAWMGQQCGPCHLTMAVRGVIQVAGAMVGH